VVLIDVAWEHGSVMGFIVISLLVLAGPLALVFGVDSRVDEVTHRRLRH
jgi:hypothetical protein